MSQTESVAVLDDYAFQSLSELIGDELAPLIQKHFNVSHAYFERIQQGVEAKDSEIIISAVHPLRSSHHQIGALKVVEICKHVEACIKNGAKDMTGLIQMVEQLNAAISEAEDEITRRLRK